MKSHSAGTIARYLVDNGATGATVATLPQAKIMVDAGIGSVLLTTPLGRATDWRQVEDLQSNAEVLVAIDAPEQLSALRGAGPSRLIPIVIELDLGLGRTGSRSIEAALELARAVEKANFTQLAGFMGYEGHVFRTWPASDKQSAFENAMSHLTLLTTEARREGMDFELITGGGTGSLFLDPTRSPLNESQAGGGVFMDQTYIEDFHVPQLEPALFIDATVVAVHPPSVAIIDAGFKAFGGSRRLPAPQEGSLQVGAVSAHMSTLTGDLDGLSVGSQIPLIPGYSDAATQGFTQLVVDGRDEPIPLRSAL